MKIIIILAKILLCQCLSDRLKKLKETAKQTKSDVKVLTETKRGASIKFIPKSDILYPGLDKEKVGKVKKLWEDYYECQNALYESTRKMVVPEAIAFLKGSNTVLECEVCESPRDIFLETKWSFAPDYNMDHKKEISETSTLSVKNNSLHIYNIREAHGGLYVCQKGNHSARPYIVHVFDSEPTKKVVALNSSEGERAADDTVVPELGLKVTTEWQQWTQCSRCDHIDLKREISAQSNNNIINDTSTKHSTIDSNVSNNSITEITKGTIETIPTTNNYQSSSLEDDLAILKIFEDGIPCRSKLLSSHIQDQDVVKNRNSEVMVAYCKIPCPKDTVFVVVDDKGNVLETANNSDGVYSVLQGVPKDIPTVTRTLEYAKYKSSFKIECPGKRIDDIPVEWYVGRKALTNKVLEKETHGRVQIDEYNRINFIPVLFEDGRIFSCWQHKELVGTVRLVVEKEHNIKFQKPVIFIGTVVIFGLFFKIYYKVFTQA